MHKKDGKRINRNQNLKNGIFSNLVKKDGLYNMRKPLDEGIVCAH
jgi:hypothetical protein